MSSFIKLKKKPLTLRLSGQNDLELVQGANQRIEEKISFDKELEQNYNRGYEEGFFNAEQKLKTKLKAEFEDELIKKAEEFYKILSSFEQKLILYDEAFQKIVCSLSIKIAEKIIGSEAANKSFIETTLQAATKKIIGANDVVVFVNPKDYELLTSNNKYKLFGEHFKKINLEADEKVAVGGCLIESEIGNVDSRIKSQLEELAKVLESHFNLSSN